MKLGSEPSRSKNRRTRFRRDEGGVSAVEFALILPIALLVLVGVFETSNLLTLYRRASTVASTAADLTAQVKTITAGELDDVMAASSRILDPYSTTPLRIVVSSVVANAENAGIVAWSCAQNGTARAAGSAYNVPTGLTEPNSSVIVAEITYAFAPLLNLDAFSDTGAFDITRTFYSRPRKSRTVQKTDAGC